jgi:hypothetical protein
MKTSKIILQDEKCNPEGVSKMPGTGKIVKSVILIFLLIMVTLLSSCMLPGPGNGSRGGPHERHGNNGHQDHDRGHDNDEHHH